VIGMVGANSSLQQRLSLLRDALSMFRRVGLLVGMRPDKYVRIAAATRREGATSTVGIAMSAQRCPKRTALIDELGKLTFRDLDVRANAFAAALQHISGGHPQMVAIMCRNHRGFVDAMAAANRIGADVLLLNTSFAGPALAEVVGRECPDVLIYDEEFTDSVDRAVAEKPDIARIVAWTDGGKHNLTVEKLIGDYTGQRPNPSGRNGKLILLTSGTTGIPKGARRSSGGGAAELTAVLSRVPWRAEETTVVAAPMFHAWGYGQLALCTLLSCTLVVRRKFDPDETMTLVDRHHATGLSVVPVMIERIMDLPDDVRSRYSGRSLRFVTASGSRMRADAVTGFMDEFGDVIYNNYNATEVGMIATATPEDLRSAPDTAGKPLPGVEVRILDDNRQEVPIGEVGQVFARSASHFDSYTSGKTKEFHDGYMASGDLGYFDESGRLFVVGRDDEMIVSGGENVYPIEVENALLTHPQVVEASVLGVEDDKFGQRLVGFVVLQNGAAADSEVLKQHVREHLANYKVPRQISLLKELPRTNTGKILRRELVERALNPDQRL
jgi:acyl-CoA synthetase (AMP-forming)/AMP-acid ligase II